MGLSRLENFLKSVRGNILYVDPNSLDATDSIENQGNSLTRPFKTIQRALIESARFSYQRGLNNDRFGKTTILVYPGDHIVDNRPGWIPDGANNFRLRRGETSNDFPPFELTTNFNLTDSDNALYKLNSIHGGVIVPRGTSIIGMDLRKTKIRPLYVPNPLNDNIDRSSIFRVTGGCYFWQFSIFDSDPNGQCYIDYTDNLFVPNFSHHKLTCFEYADGVNPVFIQDEFQTYLTDRTDLDMYYEKVGLAYGQSSGRPIEPDYPSTSLDIEPKIDEYRIVGSTGISVGITSIRSGNGITPNTTITVTTSTEISGLEVDTPIRIQGISADGYNGQYVVTEKLSSKEIRYRVQNSPLVSLPSPVGSTLSLVSDTVNSASPYIFNISLRSVYGMCGVLADGDKATGFKSMVIAQFTGIGLQKDDNAFVLYNESNGIYEDNISSGNSVLSTNSRSVYKPEYRNFHIKCINDAFLQNVSVFAIGYAEHFSVDSGGDQSITNSNSNFGSKAFVSSGFRRNAFPQDDFGYITHIIPPKELPNEEISIEFAAIDVQKTVGIATTNERIYLYNQTNFNVLPEYNLEGYRIGARENDRLRLLISNGGLNTEYSSRIVMQNSQTSSEKSFRVGRSPIGINTISSNVISLTESHTFQNGENIRIISENGELPDGLIPNTVYYAITNSNPNSGLGTDTKSIKIAKTLNDAQSANSISINNKGGSLRIVSRVSDKIPGEIGHPIQYDNNLNQWYIKVATSPTDNTIYTVLSTLSLGLATPRTYIKRKKYSRNSSDSIYRIRYVIPSKTGGLYARPPVNGFIIQESNSAIGITDNEIQTYFSSGSLDNVNQQRNFRFIANASWSSSSNTAKITTELPHNLTVGSQVELVNVTSTLNTSGIGNSGFNRTYFVSGISSSKEFVVQLDSNPGTFTNNTSLRNTSLPYYKRKKYNNVYYIHNQEEVQKYIPEKQDGVYYLTVINSSNKPSSYPFTEESFSQPIENLYPQINRDNPVSDPKESKSFASSSLIGEVFVDDVRNSITKETISKILSDNDIGIGITNIISSNSANHTIHTEIDHGLNRITKVNILYGGVGYGVGSNSSYYNARLVGFAGSTTGYHATARVTVNPSGNITNVRIMDGGSAYGIGNTLTVVGIATTTGFVRAILQVSQIYNNVGDVVRISGVSSETYQSYNDLYRITGINVGSSKSFSVTSAPISGFTTAGVGVTLTQNALTYLTGQSISVDSISYNNSVGLATVGFATNHGFSVGNKIRITGSTNSLYNGDFVIVKNLGLTSCVIDIGESDSVPSVSGTIYAYPEGITSNDGTISPNYENISGRMVSNYAGITTTLLYEVSDETIDEVSIRGIDKLDIKIGDYLLIDDEILRVKTTVPTNIGSTDPVYVFRGVLGTIASKHVINSVVKRINVSPIELRRHSIIRASGHTFEYLGFGPGNYSTSFPDKQDRELSPREEILSQSTKKEGGMSFYNGMNDKGITYSGNRKLSSSTGKEEVFDTPIQTVTGEDIATQPSINIVNSDEANFNRSIRVEGGIDGKSLSEFNGPVIFNDKVTSNSLKGFEVNSLFLQGDVDVSRKYTVGISTPTIAGNPGDVQYNANPSNNDYFGWIYTINNQWKQFGQIGASSGGGSGQTGVGIRTSGGYVGFSTLINFVGTNITVNSQYNSSLGITTLTFVGISTSDIFGNNTVGSVSGKRWSISPIVGSDGVMEIGRYIDFHNTSTDSSDYTYRLDNSSNGILQTSGSLTIGNSGDLNFAPASDHYLEFYTNTNNQVFLRLLVDDTNYHNSIIMTRGGGVDLYHNNISRLTTTASGISVTGSVSASGGISASGISVTGSISATNGNFAGIVTAFDFNATSDINLKKNILDIENSLDKIIKIRGVNFEWKSDERKSVGVIAQEVEKIIPEVVSGDEIKTVNYNGLIGYLIEAIKEQQKQIDELREKLKD